MTSQPRNIAVTRNSSSEDYLTFEPYHGRVKGRVAGKVIVDSHRAMLLTEGRLAPVLYFPRSDVRMDLLTLNSHRTYCPYRGTPVYFDLETGEQRIRNIAWSYEEPFTDSDYVKDYIAFDNERIESWETGTEVHLHTEAESLPPSLNPLIDWLVREAWQASSVSDLVTRWVEILERVNIPLLRFAVITRTLHPLLTGASYRWERESGDVLTSTIKHEVLATAQYLDSPMVSIFEGAGGVRRRLEDNTGSDDFPILAEIRKQGGTDYVAMPIVFSDGQINAITMATDQPGGFDTEHLGFINEVLPLFARLVEVFMQREKSVTLLATYLGNQTGRRVLDGWVRRGDGEDIHAVIWFCDLRGSSTHAANMSRREFLDYLNCFFDCVAGAVIDNGGEVLRFIGDAALAIFPIEPTPNGEKTACQHALDAAADAIQRVIVFNEEVAQTSRPPIAFGVGLHIGDVTYGNIGTESRLEFTVIGAAANEAARIESLCKTLSHSVLLSEDFVKLCPGDYLSLGTHHLRGTEQSKELYSLNISNLL